jgi:hypothetical protein
VHGEPPLDFDESLPLVIGQFGRDGPAAGEIPGAVAGEQVEFQGPLSSGQNVARSHDRRASRTRSSTAIGAGDSAFTLVLTSPPNIRR